MRKVTRETVEALFSQREIKRGNSAVVRNRNRGYTLFEYKLHDHTIAVYDPNTHMVHISHCNWTTPTTKERLNGILAEAFHASITAGFYSISQKDHEWYICNGRGVCRLYEDLPAYSLSDVTDPNYLFINDRVIDQVFIND